MEAQILDAATELFAARGYAGTSLQDVASATGLTRPALYHYFSSKEALLLRLVSEATVGPAGELREIGQREGASATERLHDMAASVARLQARHPERFRMLIRSEAELPAELSDAYDASRRAVLRAVTAVIEEGIRAGRFRPVDARVAALGLIGMWNWVAWWFRPDRESADAVADQLADMAIAALQRADHRTPDGEGPAAALKMLRQDLDYLERILDA